MSESNFDKLDALIALSAKSIILQEAQSFLQTEITVAPSPRFSAKVKRLIRREKGRTKCAPIRKTLKYFAIACLIAVSLLFTACMSISQIREAIWNAVVEWYDDYIVIQFNPSTQQPPEELPAPEPDTDPEVPPASPEPPAKIEQINAPTKVPYGYMVMSYPSKLNFYQEYYDEEGNFAFAFSQNPQKEQVKIDVPESDVSSLKINGFEALLLIGKDGEMSLAWSDEYYSYMLNGFFATQEELIEIANSVHPLRNQT